MFYKDVEKRKERVRRFVRKNPKATYKDIRKIGIKLEKVYKGGMEEAFKDAGIKPPRTFKRKTKEEKRKIVIDYIKKNPNVGGQTISKDTKIRFLSIFSNTKEAFDAAGVKYPREKNKEVNKKKKKLITNLVKENPLITMKEIGEKLKVAPYHFFSSMSEIYKNARIKPIDGEQKKRVKKEREVLNFIKNNPTATQREINKQCKTHVQEIFKNGIIGAYRKAGVKFPFERLKLYGIAKKDIKERSKIYEDYIATKLSGYGNVSRFVKTKRGIADVVLERKNKKVIIEIKDYKAKDISIAQIKQLNRYLEDCSCNFGILICHKKPKRDNVTIGKNKIRVIDNSELKIIPDLVERYGQGL